MKFKQSLSFALILTGFILIWNAYESPNWFVSKSTDAGFSSEQAQKKGFKNNLVDLSNFEHSFTSKVANKRIASILDSALPKSSCVNAYALVSEKSRNDPIVDLRSGSSLIPASTNKYVTAAVVLLSFDKNETLDTQLFVKEKKRNVDRAYLSTTADPSFVTTETLSPRRPSNLSPRNTRTFEDFAMTISKSGVKSIDELVVDSDWFDLPKVEQGWEKDKLQVGQIAALNIDEGFEGDGLSEDSNLYAARVLSNILAQQGVAVGTVLKGSVPSDISNDEHAIASTSSPKIATLVSDMLSTSDNVYAEQLLAAAVRTGHKKVNVDTRKEYVLNTLKGIGMNLDGFVFENGSGYSTKSRLSCGQEIQIIQKLQEKGIDLAQLASIAGVQGTLESRLLNYENRLKAKTGTLNNVTALAGKLEQRFIFSFIANSQFETEEGYQFQEAVVSSLDSYPFVKQPEL